MNKALKMPQKNINKERISNWWKGILKKKEAKQKINRNDKNKKERKK